MGCGKICGSLGSEERCWERLKNRTECVKSVVLLDEKISKYVSYF